LVALALSSSGAAYAYRPFDGTDADVASPGDFELELGPVQYYSVAGQKNLAVPTTVLNFGLGADTELVVDFRNIVTLGDTNAAREHLLDTDVLVKHVFREGTVQGKNGLSIAAEGGPLTPEINGVGRFGASLDVITSYEWRFLAAHWNEQIQYTRDRHANLFTGLILVGPGEWPVRPVTEIFYARSFGAAETWSALEGAIWSVGDSLALDAGLREALTGGALLREVRLGFTWTTPM
jgi:hypothetical protein